MRKLFIGLLVLVLVMTAIPADIQKMIGGVPEVEASVVLRNPKISQDSSMNSGQKVTYDCIWFGSYPQSKVTDEDLYKKLTVAPEEDWNQKGDIVMDGVKYRRLKRSDATHYYDSAIDGILINNQSAELYYYTWGTEDIYHYFRYEPIKWRVLNVSGNSATLMSDQILDDQRYHMEKTSVTWAQSTLRSWLNGYAASSNSCRIDYTGNNFLNTAFSANEKKIILQSKISNDDSLAFGTDAGLDTVDMVYILSESEVSSSDLAASYGFYQSDRNLEDEARCKEGTTYARAMGIYHSNRYSVGIGLGVNKINDNSSWLLRTPGADNQNTMNVNVNGRLDSVSVDDTKKGLCPVIKINLSEQAQWTYAGTVATDGTANEDAAPEMTPRKKATITAGNLAVAINNKTAWVMAGTNGDGKLTYTSSDKSVATVSSGGKITPKNYGTTTITIKSAETADYLSTSKRITVTVVPKKMVIKSVKSSARKTLILKWKKDKVASGYEIQLCRKKSFKTKTLSKKVKKTATKQKITGVPSKTWYVRIRAYKKVKGKICNGIWSTARKVKVR